MDARCLNATQLVFLRLVGVICGELSVIRMSRQTRSGSIAWSVDESCGLPQLPSVVDTSMFEWAFCVLNFHIVRVAPALKTSERHHVA